MPSANQQVHRDASRRWRQRHPEEVKAQKRLYYRRHFERLRDSFNSRNRARAAALREVAHEALGCVCSRCGFDDWRALQIDHVNGGGRLDRSRFANREQFLRTVVENSGEYQLLCANCNWIKRHERREFGSRSVTED